MGIEISVQEKKEQSVAVDLGAHRRHVERRKSWLRRR
jgi:hypothetical protein